MSNSFMSPLPTFTLESLVASGQWTAAQNGDRKKKGDPQKQKPSSTPSSGKTAKSQS